MESLRHVLSTRARLGEGPTWDISSGTLFWVDLYNHRVHRFDPGSGETRFYDVGDVVGAVAVMADDALLLARRHDLARLELRTGSVRTLHRFRDLGPEARLNDGKCDSRGRFWVGSMHRGTEGAARLYRYDPDGSFHEVEDGLTISNGLGWSPDDHTFYLTDSPARRIYAYEFDPDRGSISNRRVFADLSGASSVPDGLTIDEEGCVWSAQWDGGCVIRFGPDGSERQRVQIPVPRPTSCTFGGRDLRQLYVTTASVGMSQAEIDRYVESGDLYALDTGVRGLPANRFG